METHAHLPDPKIIKNTLKGVVQVVALKQSFFGNASVAWTGSGTIVDPSGVVLTNCHVANPRAMGMPAPPADILGIAITSRSDEPPALTYQAEIVAQSPQLDLAVLRIVADMRGNKPRRLNLPAVPLGNSDQMDLGDSMAIFGYPGIGGETVTFTSGSVAGFTREKQVNTNRAWIKTDATIAGGNSGGTAINQRGELIGVPTQAAAGAGITPVDARPVVDTNRDGRVDHRDSPMAIGGFINGLRPVNLARPLLKKAGVRVSGPGSRIKIPTAPPPPSPGIRKIGGKRGGSKRSSSTKSPSRRKRAASPDFSNLVFSTRITRDGRPINPNTVMPSGSKQIFVTFDYEGMKKGMNWKQMWALDGKTVLEDDAKWSDAASGSKTLALNNSRGLPDGNYFLALSVGREVIAQGEVVVGRAQNDTDTEISGQIVDARTGKGISKALVIALKPHVRVMDFVQRQDPNMAYVSTKTKRGGKFTFPKQLPKGQAYSMVVVARGYKDLVVESLLRISANAPERANLNPLPLQRE